MGKTDACGVSSQYATLYGKELLPGALGSPGRFTMRFQITLSTSRQTYWDVISSTKEISVQKLSDGDTNLEQLGDGHRERSKAGNSRVVGTLHPLAYWHVITYQGAR